MDQAVRIHLVALKAIPSQVPVNKSGFEVYIADVFWIILSPSAPPSDHILRTRKPCGEEKDGIKQVNRFWHQSG